MHVEGVVRYFRRKALKQRVNPDRRTKVRPARDFGARAVMRIGLPTISRASPMLLLCSVKFDQSRSDQQA
jgi:hypothetical protein